MDACFSQSSKTVKTPVFNCPIAACKKKSENEHRQSCASETEAENVKIEL